MVGGIPSDPIVIVAAIRGVVELLRYGYVSLKAAKRLAEKAGIPEFATPRALSRAVIRDEVQLGQHVRVAGHLSPFAHLYLPVSFIGSWPDLVAAESLSKRVGTRRGDTAAWRASQNPVASLPPFELDGEQVRCLFLYPNSHDSFLYHRAIQKNDNLTSLHFPFEPPRVRIPDHAHPIPVLVPSEAGLNLAGNKVRLDTLVRELPHELASRFGQVYSQHFEKEVLSNFLLLPGHQQPMSICLSMLDQDKDSGVGKNEGQHSDPRLLVYVEGHVGTSEDRRFLDHIITAAPRDQQAGPMSEHALWRGEKGEPIAASEGLGVRRHPNPVPSAKPEEQFRMIPAPQDITLMVKTPRTVGFYAETTPSRGLNARVEELQGLVGQFREGLTQTGDAESTFELDFLFDFDRQWQFDDLGALGSQTALEAIRGDQELDSTREWLRGNPY